MFAQPKPKPLKELGIKTIDVYINKLDQDLISSETDKQTDDDMDNEDPFSWTGLIKIDAIIYPTMQGALDIDQEGPLYILFGTLLLPDGKAEISDRFLFTVNSINIMILIIYYSHHIFLYNRIYLEWKMT